MMMMVMITDNEGLFKITSLLVCDFIIRLVRCPLHILRRYFHAYFPNCLMAYAAGRSGVNNATAYSEHFKQTVCPSLETDLAHHQSGSPLDPTAPYKCSVW
jgi:hypothetical protein